MFSQPSTLPSQVALGIAAARERPSSLRIEHHGADLLGSSHLSSAAHAGDDLTEEDIWSVHDGDSLSSDGIIKVPSHDHLLPSIRLTNRARPDPVAASTSTAWFSNQAHGLAVLSSESLIAGQVPINGDIVKPNTGAPVGIPTIQTHLDHFNSRRSQGHHRASAPVNVPDWSKITGTARPFRRPFDESDDNADNIMVPPHEMVARDSSTAVCFSVHEGLGGTLRGRDLDRLRTAILQKTGFYE